MHVGEIKAPEWIEKGSVTVRLIELDPNACEALIETLRNSAHARNPEARDDDRVRLLMDLWDALTGGE